MSLLIVKTAKYENQDAISNVINYIIRSEFTNHYLVGSIATLNTSFSDMPYHFEQVQKAWNKCDKKRVQHIILSIGNNKLLTVDEIYSLGYIVANYIAQRFQVVFAVHTASKTDANNQHIHLAINTISYVDGTRFYGTKSDYYDIIAFIKSYLGDELTWKVIFD